MASNNDKLQQIGIKALLRKAFGHINPNNMPNFTKRLLHIYINLKVNPCLTLEVGQLDWLLVYSLRLIKRVYDY